MASLKFLLHNRMNRRMNRKMNRKAQFFIIGVVVIFIIVMIFALISMMGKQKFQTEDVMAAFGNKQTAVIEAYQNGESALIYLDLSAQYSFSDALAALARNGGFATRSSDSTDDASSAFLATLPCGQYIYPSWNNRDMTCIPEAQKNFFRTYESFMDDFLSQYGTVFPTDNYQMTAQIDAAKPLITIHATALDSLHFSVALVEDTIEPVVMISGSGSSFPPEFVDIKDSTAYPNIICEANVECKFMPDVAKKLKETAQFLQDVGDENGTKYTLVIKSGSRTLAMQKALYDSAQKTNPGSAARPTPNAPHVQGRAVDVTFERIDTAQTSGHAKFFAGHAGVAFSEQYYASKFTPSQRADQKMVEALMCENGWSRWANEWWHFEYGTRNWEAAQSTKNTCVFGTVRK